MRNQGKAAATGIALLLVCSPLRAWACVVDSGTGASCTESALNACLPGGGSFDGTVTFNCGGAATITLTSTKTISANTTVDGGGVITLHNSGSAAFAVNSGVAFTVENLTLSGTGDGIDTDTGTVTATNCTFTGNNNSIDASSGGAVTATGCTFTGNDDGIYAGGAVTATGCTFAGNNDGISAAGAVTAIGCTFTGNVDGISTAGAVTATGCTFDGNVDGISAGSVTATNCTFAKNAHNGISAGSATATNCTFANNDNDGISTSAATLTNTILTNSGLANCGAGTVTDGGHNIDDGTTCGFTGTNCTNISGTSFCNTNPGLAAGLASNGGPTQTIALLSSSPAINAGDEALCSAPPVNNLDQRGYARPGTGSANCSIGAYEYNSLGIPDCCQCPTSCAAPINGLCGDCVLVPGATCASGDLCVLHTQTPTPTPTRTVTPTITQTFATKTPTLTPTSTPTTPPTEMPTNTPTHTVATTATPTATTIPTGTPTETPTPSQTPTSTDTVSSRPTIPATVPVTLTPTPSPPRCVGDCTSNGQVTVTELIEMVNIALGNAQVPGCSPGDANDDGEVTVDEIITAVNNALNGCPELPRPTGTPTWMPTSTAAPTATSTPTATNAPCLVDNGDGTITDCAAQLMWEKKSDDDSLHDKDFYYVWAGTCAEGGAYCQPSSEAAAACAAGTGSASMLGCAQCATGDCICKGAACNSNAANPGPATNNYTTIWQWLAWLNSANFASHSDWRIPKVHQSGTPAVAELETILNPVYPSCTTPPCAYSAFNTNCTAGCTVTTGSCTRSSYHWSATSNGGDPTGAWFVDFNDGLVYGVGKGSDGYVRAVRGGS